MPDDTVRERITRQLATGLPTDWQTRAYEDSQIADLLTALRNLPPGDLEGKLKVSGFTQTPYVAKEDPEIEQSCATCMYYEVHRKWCVLPELDLPVEPEWSCTLWRI